MFKGAEGLYGPYKSPIIRPVLSVVWSDMKEIYVYGQLVALATML